MMLEKNSLERELEQQKRLHDHQISLLKSRLEEQRAKELQQSTSSTGERAEVRK